MTKNEARLIAVKCCEVLGAENKILVLLGNAEWKQYHKQNLGSQYVGCADRGLATIGLQYRDRNPLDLQRTAYHEIGHILFPSKPHWWVECFATVLNCDCFDCRDHPGRYSKRYKHSVEELPPRDNLIALAQKAARRLNPDELKIERIAAEIRRECE